LKEIKDFIKYEFIGAKVEVINSKNKHIIGLYGTIIDETKNTFKIETENGIKVVPKRGNTFIFYFKDYWILVDGSIITERPWERIKKKVRKII